MSKKKRAKKHNVPKTGAVWRQTSEEATLAKMPRYDAFAGGYGPHGSKKHDRAKVKQDWRRQIGQEGASRGSFPLCAKAPGTSGADIAQRRRGRRVRTLRKGAGDVGRGHWGRSIVSRFAKEFGMPLDPLVASGPMMPLEDTYGAMV